MELDPELELDLTEEEIEYLILKYMNIWTPRYQLTKICMMELPF